MQELSAVGGALERETAGVRESQAEASLLLLRHAEVAVRSFLSLRPRFIAAQAHMYDFYSGMPAKPSPFLQQTVMRYAVCFFCFNSRYRRLSALPISPGACLENSTGVQLLCATQSSYSLSDGIYLLWTAFSRFENQLAEYRQRIEEMERLLLVNTEKENSYGSQLSLLQSLPSVMTNVHDFFIHVAAEVSMFQGLTSNHYHPLFVCYFSIAYTWALNP